MAARARILLNSTTTFFPFVATSVNFTIYRNSSRSFASFREIKAFADIVSGLRKVAENASSESRRLELERYALSVEKTEFQIKKEHSEEIVRLKANHSQAIEALKQKHRNEISALNTQHSDTVRQLQSTINDLQKDQLPKNFVEHGGLLWKQLNGQFETTPYCKKCTLPMYDADSKWICTHCGHATQHISPPTV